MNNPARLTTVTSILKHPGSGDPIVGKRVSIRLSTRGFINGGTAEIIRTRYATTDATGMWSLALEVNADIDPGGTYWTVREFDDVQPFIVTYSATPVTLRSCLVVDPTSPNPLVAGVQSVTGAGVDNTDPLNPVITGGGGGGVSNIGLDTDGVPYFQVGASAASIAADTDGVPYFQAA